MGVERTISNFIRALPMPRCVCPQQSPGRHQFLQFQDDTRAETAGDGNSAGEQEGEESDEGGDGEESGGGGGDPQNPNRGKKNLNLR